MSGELAGQMSLRKRAPQVDTAQMLLVGYAAAALIATRPEGWTTRSLVRVLDVRVTSGVGAEERLREVLRVIGYWQVPGGAHLLAEARRQGDLAHQPDGPPMPAWATLTEPTSWHDVHPAEVFGWVDRALHASDRGLWPSINALRTAFGKAPANPRPSHHPGHPSLLDG